MARRSEFTRLFCELTDPLNKAEVAQRIGVTPPYVSQLRKGTYSPSRSLLERIVAEFGVDRDTWFRAADLPPAGAADERRLIAQEAAEEALRRFLEFRPLEYLGERMNAMVAHYGEPIGWEWGGVTATDTREHVDLILERVERRLREINAEARKKPPLFITEP